MSADKAAAHILIKGRVQGVGYRFFAQEAAYKHGLMGWVRNLPDRDVECEVEGSRSSIENFIADLRKGPSLGRVDEVRLDWRLFTGQFAEFSIL